MRGEAPALLPIFRSRQLARLLAAVLLQPEREHTISGLAEQIGIPIPTLHREADRLVEAGIVRDRRVGRTRVLTANTDSRLVGPLTELLLVTYGPLTVIGEEFDAIADVDLVLIYGSWAARYEGQRGPLPNDIDVLVIGTPSRSEVYDAAERAQRRLGIPVNPSLGSPRRWSEASDALIQQIQASPYLPVIDRRAEKQP